MPLPATDPDTTIATLANGVRVIAIALPQFETAAVSVFVRSGSQHEDARLAGLSHVVEHMAFKGTVERDCQRINLDAERLGAEVNAHTDKDHTAFHMRGLAPDAAAFVHMLADIVRHGTFPEDELERERQVILHEYAEDEDDPLSIAFRLFDRGCYGEHALGRPVIGTRQAIARITRADLLECVGRRYTGANLVVGAAGRIDPTAIVRAAEAAFGDMPPGEPNTIDAPVWHGGLRARRSTGSPQAHLVLGFPIAPLREARLDGVLAAALFGEGMSSPLMDQVRERRALAYYAACSADLYELGGQFVVEAATAPAQVDEFFDAVAALLVEQAQTIDPVGLARARNQIRVRQLSTREQPVRRLEAAALDLLVLGRVRGGAELAAALDAVSTATLRDTFAAMFAAGASVAMAGSLRRGAEDRVAQALCGRGLLREAELTPRRASPAIRAARASSGRSRPRSAESRTIAPASAPAGRRRR